MSVTTLEALAIAWVTIFTLSLNGGLWVACSLTSKGLARFLMVITGAVNLAVAVLIFLYLPR